MPTIRIQESDRDFGRYFPLPAKPSSATYYVRLRGTQGCARRKLRREHRTYRKAGGGLSLRDWVRREHPDA